MPLTSPTIEIRVLGRVEIWGAPTPDRPAAIELAALLALHHDRRYTGDQLRNEMFRAADDGGNAYASDTIRVYMASLRRAWGPDHVPSAAGGAGYRLVVVITDWQRFQALLTAASATPPAERGRLVDALTLVRGAALRRDRVGHLRLGVGGAARRRDGDGHRRSRPPPRPRRARRR